MDRSLKKGPVGLACAWLALHSHVSIHTKLDHDVLKAVIGSASGLADRKLARDAFAAQAQAEGGLFLQVLEAEYEATGSRDEPDTVD